MNYLVGWKVISPSEGFKVKLFKLTPEGRNVETGTVDVVVEAAVVDVMVVTVVVVVVVVVVTVVAVVGVDLNLGVGLGFVFD